MKNKLLKHNNMMYTKFNPFEEGKEETDERFKDAEVEKPIP